jgi:hypothetical protein
LLEKAMTAMAMTRLALISALLLLSPTVAPAQQSSAPEDARVYFIWPEDGATLKGAFRARFGLRNMGVTHAGDNFPNSGHHHLFIDVEKPFDLKAAIPHDKNHIHFAAGETEARLELPPGRHTLQLVLGDTDHFPFKPPVVSEKITVTVKAADVVRDSGATRSGGRKAGGNQTTAARRPPSSAATSNARQDNCGPSVFSRMVRGCNNTGGTTQ